MNEKFVINIGRQLGSGGKAVGERLAERFGIPVYDKRLIKMAAEHSGFGQEFFEKADEKPAKGFFATLLGYLRSPFAGDDAIYNNPLSHDALFKMQSDVIRQLAERESCIFVGRCADYILREHPRCVNIFVSASREDRIERLVRTRRLTPEAAEQLMDSTDEKRADYYNYYSNRTWGAAATYHLCIDSSVLGHRRHGRLRRGVHPQETEPRPQGLNAPQPTTSPYRESSRPTIGRLLFSDFSGPIPARCANRRTTSGRSSIPSRLPFRRAT